MRPNIEDRCQEDEAMECEDITERRRQRRVPVDLPVTMRSLGVVPVTAKIIDLTPTGGGVLHRMPIQPGSMVELRFTVPDQSISRELRLKARVVHNCEAEVTGGGATDRCCVIGFELIDLNPEDEALIENYLSSIF